MATTIMAGAGTLTEKEMAIVDLGAAVARGEQDKVSVALKSGFDAGLTLNEAKELVGQSMPIADSRARSMRRLRL